MDFTGLNVTLVLYPGEVLRLVTDPTIAVTVALCGVGLMVWEFLRPGGVIPGVCGAILLVVGLLALLGEDWTLHGKVLIMISFVCALRNLRSPSGVSILVCGVAFGTGLLLLITGEKQVSGVVAIAGASVASACAWLLSIASRARRAKRFI